MPIRLILGGDLMLGRGVDAEIQRLGPDYPLEPLRPLLRQADLVAVNLECAITPRRSLHAGAPKAFYFRADPLAVRALTSAGIGLVTLANNHALDAGESGLGDTLALLAGLGIAAVGAGDDIAQARAPVLVDVAGARLAVLAYCDHQPDFAADERHPGINFIDLGDDAAIGRMLAEVSAAAGAADHLVVAFHWLPNWVPSIPPSYRDLAHRLVDAGARLVWGHSPHHFLGVERIAGSVVLYATGDLVDDYALEPDFRNDRQLLFLVELGASGVGRVRAHPIELAYARTAPAGGEARRWIVDRFASACAAVGSRVEASDGWIDIA